jgi:hypothetical protein
LQALFPRNLIHDPNRTLDGMLVLRCFFCNAFQTPIGLALIFLNKKTNFCASEDEITVDAGDIDRDAMIQPNVYWTLNVPFVTIIGLYSNVPDGGVIKDDEFNWFKGELESAPKDKALIISVHHAPFS